MPRHPCQHSSISFPCRKLWCLFTCKKSTYSLTFFLRYCTLRNPAIWLANSILTRNLRTRLSTGKEFAVKYKWQCFILDYFQKKLKKPTFWPTAPIFGQKRIFLWILFLSVFFKRIPTKYHLAKVFEGKVMSGFQATLISEARMHTCMVQAYHETLHTSYHFDSEINFLSVSW